MHEDFFTPGELARLCGISKSLLLYYDRQGILKPACIDSKGFRYYAAKQFFVLENITALRKLDIPLPDIKRFLSYRSTEQLNLLYKNKLKDCHEKIAQYQHYEKQLLENIEALSASENITVNQILLQELPVIDYLAECEIFLSQPVKERILTICRFIRPYLQKDYMHKFYSGRYIDSQSFFLLKTLLPIISSCSTFSEIRRQSKIKRDCMLPFIVIATTSAHRQKLKTHFNASLKITI